MISQYIQVWFPSLLSIHNALSTSDGDKNIPAVGKNAPSHAPIQESPLQPSAGTLHITLWLSCCQTNYHILSTFLRWVLYLHQSTHGTLQFMSRVIHGVPGQSRIVRRATMKRQMKRIRRSDQSSLDFLLNRMACSTSSEIYMVLSDGILILNLEISTLAV